MTWIGVYTDNTDILYLTHSMPIRNFYWYRKSNSELLIKLKGWLPDDPVVNTWSWFSLEVPPDDSAVDSWWWFSLEVPWLILALNLKLSFCYNCLVPWTHFWHHVSLDGRNSVLETTDCMLINIFNMPWWSWPYTNTKTCRGLGLIT